MIHVDIFATSLDSPGHTAEHGATFEGKMFGVKSKPQLSDERARELEALQMLEAAIQEGNRKLGIIATEITAAATEHTAAYTVLMGGLATTIREFADQLNSVRRKIKGGK